MNSHPAPAPEVMDAPAAAELSQELTLVARALFTQLLPGTAEHALSGVPGMGPAPTLEPAPVEPPAVPAPAPGPMTTDTATPGVEPALAPALPALPVTPAAPVALPVPGTTIPVPGVPVPPAALRLVGQPPPSETAASETPPSETASTETAAPSARPERHSLAMLEEIGFLDE